MKKHFGIIAAVLASVMLLTASLTGCGSSGPTEEDAQKYVQAILDLMCTGEYDKSVKFANIEEGAEMDMRESLIDNIVEEYTQETNLGQEAKIQMRDFLVESFSKCRYTVGEAVKTDDRGETGYDVKVTVEPLKVFEGSSDALQDTIGDLISDTEKIQSLSQDELTDLVYDSLFDVLDNNIENPQYQAPEEITVHYGLIDKEHDIYGVNENEAAKIGTKLFSTEGLEMNK